MKITYMSDVHLEFEAMELVNPGSDVLVLAGDICVADHFKRGEGSPYVAKAERYIDFFRQAAEKWEHVIYVMGNHEHYHGQIDMTFNTLKMMLIKNDLVNKIKLLENRSVVIDDVEFIGATLWTDVNGNNPVSGEIIRSGMNDYHVIKHPTHRKLIPQDTFVIHNDSRRFIEERLADGEGKKVVVTHHAPSYQSIAPEYVGSNLNPGYASSMDQFVEDSGAALWIHGHIHATNDYAVGDTRVLSNPRGYHGENGVFDPEIVVEI